MRVLHDVVRAEGRKRGERGLEMRLQCKMEILARKDERSVFELTFAVAHGAPADKRDTARVTDRLADIMRDEDATRRRRVRCPNADVAKAEKYARVAFFHQRVPGVDGRHASGGKFGGEAILRHGHVGGHFCGGELNKLGGQSRGRGQG